MTTICRKCGGPINSISQHRFGSEATGWEHMEGECDPYPEHTKLMAISELSQACYDFIEWLGDEKGAVLCAKRDGHRNHDSWECPWMPVGTSIRDLLSQHFGIDPNKLEAEKLAMIDALREMNS